MARGKIGALFGLLVGATLGILFAPRKGKELRRKIKEEIDKGGTGLDPVKKAFKGMGDNIVESCKECYDEENLEELVERGKAKARRVARKTVRKAKKGLDKAEKKVRRKLKARKKK